MHEHLKLPKIRPLLVNGFPNMKFMPKRFTVVLQKSTQRQNTLQLSQRGDGCSLSVSAFIIYHERAPMSCLQGLDALEASNNGVQRNHQWL